MDQNEPPVPILRLAPTFSDGWRQAMGRNPSQWWLYSMVLMDSAAAVPHREVQHMLYGMAIEDALKGMLLADGVDPFTPTGELRDWFRTHNLVALAGQLSLRLTEDQRSVLESLSYYITVAGRYPTTSRPGQPLRYNRLPAHLTNEEAHTMIWELAHRFHVMLGNLLPVPAPIPPDA